MRFINEKQVIMICIFCIFFVTVIYFAMGTIRIYNSAIVAWDSISEKAAEHKPYVIYTPPCQLALEWKYGINGKKHYFLNTIGFMLIETFIIAGISLYILRNKNLTH